MNLNMFKIKRVLALLLAGLFSAIAFVAGDIYYGFWGGIGFLAAGVFLGVLIGSALLKNPFTSMLEGSGIMVFDISSTGIIRPFIAQVHNPYMSARNIFKDVFDRMAVFNLAVPKRAGKATPTETGGLDITMDEESYNKGRFALFHYPVVLWNSQLKSVVTKDWLSEKENDIFANHTILYLNRSLEELTSVVRDFARHVVDQIRPKGEWLKSKWVVWIIIGVAILLAIMFLPKIFTSLGGVGGTVKQSVSSISPVSPQ